MEAVSCWDCAHRQAGGLTFLGLCRYFERLGKEPREIPGGVVDVGCKHFTHGPLANQPGATS